MRTNKISGVVITFNEEKNIKRCIESMQGVVDEVLVVDSDSADSTVAICKDLGARVIIQPFLGYIEQKNFAMQQAKYEYVLSLDADETLSPDLQKSIVKVKKNLNKDAYRFNRLNNFYGKWLKHGKWYPDRKTRLWDRGKARWGGTNPHDKVILHPSLSVANLSGDLLHYAYPSVEDHFRQMLNFAVVQSRAMWQQNKQASVPRMLLSPLYNFVYRYFFRLGFLDGYYGFIACLNSSIQTYYKYANLRELQKRDFKN